MSASVFTAIGQKSDRMLHKATENLDICQRFMGVVGRTVVMSIGKGKAWQDVRIAPIEMSGLTMKAAIMFPSIHMPHSPSFLGHVDGMIDYVGRKAGDLAGAVAGNPTYLQFLDDLVGKVDAYAADKGKEFSDVRFSKAIIDDTDTIVFELEP